MEASSVGVSGQLGPQDPTGNDAFRDVNLDDFLKMLIAEMQNQDPMNPMENHEILQQISQIREIESNTWLSETLESVLLGQNVATAGSMIGRSITGLDVNGDLIAGRVERVSIADGQPRLHVGQHTIGLTNVSEILSTGEVPQTGG